MAIKLYFTSLIVFLVVDFLWLAVLSKKIYQNEIGPLLSEPKWIPAVIFYLLFIVGLVFFVLLPGINQDSLTAVIKSALLFGLVTYATYDLTNLATLKGWSAKLVIIDLIWGMTVTAITAIVTYQIAHYFSWRG